MVQHASGKRQIGRQIELQPGRYHRLLQVIGRIRPRQGGDRLEDGRNIVLKWLRSKKRWQISDEQALSDRPLHLEAEDSVKALSVESAPGFWAVRLDDPCEQVPGRLWRVELVLVDGRPDEWPAFGCTLSAFVPSGGNPVLKTPGVPAVIGMMARAQGLRDAGRSLDGGVWEVDRPRELDELVGFIESPTRTVSVVVVSAKKGEAPFVPVAEVARKMAGIGVVVGISTEAAEELTRRYSRALGVFGNAIRMYRVGFNPDVDPSLRHPLYIEHSWSRRMASLYAALQFDAMQDSVMTRDHGRDLPGFGEIRRIAADRRLLSAMSAARGASSFDTDAFERDIQQLKTECKDWQEFAYDEERKAKSSEEAQLQTKARLYQYRDRIRALEQRLAELEDLSVPAIPDRLDLLQEWAEQHLAGRLVITARAARAASQAQHDDIGKIYESIHLLGTLYWDMKAKGDAKAALDEAVARLKVRISPTGQAVDTKRYEDEYQVVWEGTKYRLDLHLAGSESRDIRRGLRIYFAWDDDQQLVIVGHLPTHLTNIHT